MPLKPNRRKHPYTLNKQLRRRFYNGAAIATLVYVLLSLVRFHGQFSYLPYVLAVIWAVFLLCYTTIKEAVRWSDIDDPETYRGELWAGIVIAGAAWMILWNIVRAWIFHLQTIPFPDDYQAAVIETIVLYTLSVISSLIYKYKNKTAKATHRKKRHRMVHRPPKPLVALTNKPEAPPNPVPEAVLTEAKTLEDKKPPNP